MSIAISTRNFTALTACLLLISACALPMEKLVNDALMTGDWSHDARVDAREHKAWCARNDGVYIKDDGIGGRGNKCFSRDDYNEGLQRARQ